MEWGIEITVTAIKEEMMLKINSLLPNQPYLVDFLILVKDVNLAINVPSVIF
jgi:hypothetical protein